MKRILSLVLSLTLLLTLFVLWQLGVSGPLLGLSVSATLSLPLLLEKHKKLAWILTGTLCVAAVLFVFFYTGTNQTLREASQVLHGTVKDSFGSGRVAIWRDLIPLISERPLLGGGCGTLYLRGLEPFYWSGNGGVIPVAITSAHNEYLGILTDQGLLALLSFLLLCALALHRCCQNAHSRHMAVCAAVLLCYLIQACFSVSTCITAIYLWLLLAVISVDAQPAASPP